MPQTRFAAFLRGMNVGGHRVRAPELCALFGALGLEQVSAFRASGNVVFTAGAETDGLGEAELTGRIERHLQESLGYEVATFLRSAEEMRVIAQRRPFSAQETDASQGKLQVGMLAGAPSAQARSDLLALASDLDRLALGERELYWLPSGGILDSPLDMKVVGGLLGPMTVRTKGTIEQLYAKHFLD